MRSDHSAGSPTLTPHQHQRPGSGHRVDGYADLRDYAVIGDGRTVALVALDGGIDWFPIPDLDSVPVFAALLDAEHGGRIELRPVDDAEVERHYVDGTNVVATTFRTAGGVVRITDSLNTGVAGRLPWAELARRVEGLAGEVPLCWRVAPGTVLGTASPWVHDTARGVLLRVDDLTLAVRAGDVGEPERSDQQVSGSFTATAGSRHLLAVVGTHREPVNLPRPAEIDARIDRTIASWQDWSREFRYDGAWQADVRRSALALKLLLHSPTGSIAAAATTSLPERIGGDKNYDYRYAWVRDTAFTLHALIRCGLHEEVHAAVAWLLATIRRHQPGLQVFYRLNGELPDGHSYPDVPGWRGSRPVVDGNAAAGQTQLSIFGDLFDVFWRYVEAGHALDAFTGRMLSDVADRCCDLWQQRDAGLWELADEQHYTSSKLGCWQALDCAVRLAGLEQLPGSSDRWRMERDRIGAYVRDHCWSEAKQAYTRCAGSEELDASVLLGAGYGFDRGPRMSSTIDALYAELGTGPLLHRYTGAQDEEGAFTACAFWAVEALALVGRADEAHSLMDRLLPLANDVGLFSEMMDPSNYGFLGNLPQGLSHLALINAALTVADASPHLTGGHPR